MCEFDKLDKTFASDLYLIYKRSPSARVCISNKDQLLIMFYLFSLGEVAQRTLEFQYLNLSHLESIRGTLKGERKL